MGLCEWQNGIGIMLTAFVCMAERDRDNVDCFVYMAERDGDNVDCFVCMAERDMDNVDCVWVYGRKG